MIATCSPQKTTRTTTQTVGCTLTTTLQNCWSSSQTQPTKSVGKSRKKPSSFSSNMSSKSSRAKNAHTPKWSSTPKAPKSPSTSLSPEPSKSPSKSSSNSPKLQKTTQSQTTKIRRKNRVWGAIARRASALNCIATAFLRVGFAGQSAIAVAVAILKRIASAISRFRAFCREILMRSNLKLRRRWACIKKGAIARNRAVRRSIVSAISRGSCVLISASATAVLIVMKNLKEVNNRSYWESARWIYHQSRMLKLIHLCLDNNNHLEDMRQSWLKLKALVLKRIHSNNNR